MNFRKPNSSNSKSQEQNKIHPDNPLYNLILHNYQRSQINSSMVSSINAFLVNLTNRLFQTNQQHPIKNQHIKVIVELITTFENNLIQLQNIHSVTSQDIINFFKNLISIFQAMAQYWKDYENLVSSDIINALWILLEKDIIQVRLPQFDKKIESLSSLMNTTYQNLKQGQINYLEIMKQNFLLVGKKQKEQLFIKNLYISFLRVSNTNKNFKNILFNYLSQCFLSHHVANFKKAFQIYQNFGSSFEQRRKNKELLLMKCLEHNHALQYVNQINKTFAISKIISRENALHFVIKLLQKIIQSSSKHQVLVLLLQQLSCLNITPFNASQKQQFKAEQFLGRVLEWVISIKDNKRNQEMEIRQKMIQAQIKEDKVIEFVKKLSYNKASSTQDSQQSKQDYQLICKHLGVILKKLVASNIFNHQKMMIDLDQFSPLRTDKFYSQTLKHFLLDIVPYLINQIPVSLKEANGMKCGILVKAAQLYCEKNVQRQSSIKEYFTQSYHQMISANSCNYHFVLCLIFMRNCRQKQQIQQFLINEMSKDLDRQQSNKSNRNIILNLSLLINLVNHHFHIQPIKFKIKQMLNKLQILAQNTSISQLITVYYKEVSIVKHEKPQLQLKYSAFRDKLNSKFQNYKKDSLNVFYYLLMGLNDVLEQQGTQLGQTLSDMKFMQKLNLISQPYTIIRCFNQKMKQFHNKGVQFDNRKNLIFLMTMKLHYSIKNGSVMQNSDELDTFFQFLRSLILKLTKNLDENIISSIENLKSNIINFKQDKYLEMIKQKVFIKLYSQLCEKQKEAYIISIRIMLSLIKNILSIKALSVQSIEPEFQYLYLLYSFDDRPSDLAFNQKDQQLSKIYLTSLKLKLSLSQKQKRQDLIVKIRQSLSNFKQAVLQTKHQFSLFKQNYPIDFTKISIDCIRSLFQDFSPSDISLFKLIVSITEEDNKQNCSFFQNKLKECIQRQFGASIYQLVYGRIEMGSKLEESSKMQFHKVSSFLYPFMKDVLTKDKTRLLKLVQDIIQIDLYCDCNTSGFILKEITFIFAHIQDKNSQICETIFGYIQTLTDIFGGEEKLQISNFICKFFGLNINFPEADLNKIDKNVTHTCSNAFVSFKSPKVDDKKLICFGCSVTCHKDQPVFYLNFPPEYKVGRCQCRQIPNFQCKFVKSTENISNGLGASKNKPQIYARPFGAYASKYISSGGQYERINRYSGPGRAFLRENLFGQNEGIAMEMNSINPDEQYELQQEAGRMGSRYYQSMKQEFFPRISARYDQGSERQQLMNNRYNRYKALIDKSQPVRNNIFMQNMQSFQNKEKEIAKQEIIQICEPQFVDEQYQQADLKMEIQNIQRAEQHPAILRKYPLLPKFIDLIVNFCSKASQKNVMKQNTSSWKVQFSNPTITKICQANFKVFNAGTYHLQIRKQNPINNVSCVTIKKNLANNNKFVVIASGSDMHVYVKQKLFILALETKNQSNFSPIHRHSVGFQIHSLQFSPTDKSVLCAAGLYNLALYNISNDGIIAKTNHRYNVNNQYINKIKLAKMGIFIGVEKEIRVLNYTCKHFLTLKPQESNTLIRQWSVFQKSAGCQVYFACPNGNIFFTEIMPSDQGKKEFTGKITDQRKNKNNTGASIHIKEIPQVGKILFASFKDGSNIIGPLDGDQMIDMADMRLKGIKSNKNIFDTNFIIGHFDTVHIPETDDLYVICTTKKYFPPQMSFHQGFLTLIRFTKDGNTQIQILNEDSTCQLFQVFYLGPNQFFIVSMNTDGSLHIATPTKLSRSLIDEQFKKPNETQLSGNRADEGKNNNEKVQKLRNSILQQLSLSRVSQNTDFLYNFRQNSQLMKIGAQYSLLKLNQIDYELKQLKFNKIITGVSLPQFGNIQLPTRTINNVMQFGLTNMQALWFFAKGSIKFKYTKNTTHKFVRQNLNINGNTRILEKLQKMERLNEYSQEKMPIPGMLNSLLGIKQDNNLQIQFVSKPFQSFKARIPKFDETFSVQGDNQSSTIEKTALIIKMFLTKALKQEDPCSKQQILNLIQALKKIIGTASKNIYKLLQQVMILAVRVYQNLTSTSLSLQHDENYPLRAATQNRMIYYLNLLKVDIPEEQFNDFLELISEIIQTDINLIAFYFAKYPIVSQINKRLKKPDTTQRAEALVQIYIVAYPVLKMCDISYNWIITTLCTIISAYVNTKSVKAKIYESLAKTNSWTPMGWLKNIIEGKQEIQQPNNLIQNMMVEEAGGKDPLMQIYNMASRGQIDQQTLIRMIQDATKFDYEKQNQAVQRPAEDQMIIEPQQQLLMEQKIIAQEPSPSLIDDIIEECTSVHQKFQVISSRIILLYITARSIDKHFPDKIILFLKKIRKIISQIDVKMDNEKVNLLIFFSSLYNHIIQTNQTLKDQKVRQMPIYQEIQTQVYSQLAKVDLQKVTKISKAPNYLFKIFKGEKPNGNIHIAYALSSFLIYPCEPNHILLSLECYWLLPQSKEYYSKQKSISMIRDGMNSGNILKVWEIANKQIQIWQQSEQYLQILERWIKQKTNHWQTALELLALYYSG